MSTTKSKNSLPVKNNGGSSINVSNGVLSSVGLGSSLTVYGSTVVDGTETDAALVGGVFAYNNKRPVAKRVTSTLAAVSNTSLISGAADPARRRSIARMEAVRTTLTSTAYRAGKYNVYTGKFEAGYPQVSVDDAMVVAGGVYKDQAANPTRQVPGELVYRTGAKVPVMADYKQKNG
jgi:hypothetical protein